MWIAPKNVRRQAVMREVAHAHHVAGTAFRGKDRELGSTSGRGGSDEDPLAPADAVTPRAAILFSGGGGVHCLPQQMCDCARFVALEGFSFGHSECRTS